MIEPWKRKKLILGIAAALLFVGAGGFAWRVLQTREFRHVFVNETADHRFDESIQVSILSAHKRTGVQNAVVITNRFSVEEMQPATARLFEKLHLGKANHGRAILYLYSPERKSLKIEVGYALEGVLPDIQARFFEMAAKSFIFNDHYQDFWAELINTVNIEIAEKERAGGKSEEENFDFSKLRFVSGGGGVLSTQYAATPEQLEQEMRRLPPAAKSVYAGSPDLLVSLQNYLESLRQGIGDDQLPLLSAESRLFRSFTPLTTYQLYRNWRMYSQAGIDKTFTVGDFSFVFFRNNHPVLPLVFVRRENLWLAHEPLSWSLFQRFEDSMQVFLKFPLLVPSPDFQAYLQRNFGRPLYEAAPVALENLLSGNASTSISYFYFRLYWLDRVAKEIDENPALLENPETLWIALDVNNNLGRFTKFLETMETIVKRNPQDQRLKKNLIFYREAFQFTGPSWQLSLE